jgi:hypothetical protein
MTDGKATLMCGRAKGTSRPRVPRHVELMDLRPRLSRALGSITLALAAWTWGLPALAAETGQSAEAAEISSLTLPPVTRSELKVDTRTYEIFVMRPSTPPPPEGYPLLVVLDANAHFATAAMSAYIRSIYGDITPTVVVGVGYPAADDNQIQARRSFDFTNPLISKSSDPYFGNKVAGGAAAFRDQVLATVLKQMDAQEHVNPQCHVLFGHSLGGLFVVDTAFRKTGMFEGYFAASPSLHFDHAEILDRIPTAAQWAAQLTSPVRLHLEVGLKEASLSDRLLKLMPVYATAPNYRQVSNFGRLTEDLWDERVPKLRVTSEVLNDESHVSELPRVIGEAITFASECPSSGPAS